MSFESQSIKIFLALSIIALTAFPWTGDEFYVEFITHLMILSIFAMSLDLLVGYTGLVSFGHAAFFGLSGYLLAIIAPPDAPANLLLLLPICLGITAITALIIGWIAIRTSGIYFIMITLAFAQMFYYFFNDFPAFGGSDGIFVPYRPQLSFLDLTLIDLENNVVFYYIVLIALIGCYYFLRTIIRAPFGQVLKSIKTNERRTRSLGYNTRNYKLISFTIAGVFAGLAGFLEASHSGIISPAHLSWHESGLVLMTVIFGGMGTLYGAVIGAFVLGLLQDQLQIATEHWMLYLGIIIILVVLLMPHGIAGIVKSRRGQNLRSNGDKR